MPEDNSTETPVWFLNPERLCRVCHLELPQEEINLNRTWHFTCEKCVYCGHEPNATQIEACLLAGIPISHTVCYRTAMYREFKTKTLPYRMEHIRFLTAEILKFHDNIAPDTTDLSVLYNIHNELKELTINVGHVLETFKSKIRIRDNETFNIQQTTERKAANAKKAESEVEKQAGVEKTARLKAEREDPKLKDYRKAIEGIATTFGWTFEQAETYLKKRADELKAKGEA